MSHRSMQTEAIYNVRRNTLAVETANAHAESVSDVARRERIRAAVTASLIWAGVSGACLAAHYFLNVTR